MQVVGYRVPSAGAAALTTFATRHVQASVIARETRNTGRR
jgi:hypothetical protein